jgi:hypothetical protein
MGIGMSCWGVRLVIHPGMLQAAQETCKTHQHYIGNKRWIGMAQHGRASCIVFRIRSAVKSTEKLVG